MCETLLLTPIKSTKFSIFPKTCLSLLDGTGFWGCSVHIHCVVSTVLSPFQFSSLPNSLCLMSPHCVTCLSLAEIRAPDSSPIAIFSKVTSTNPRVLDWWWALVIRKVNFFWNTTLIKIDPFSPETARTPGPLSSSLAALPSGRWRICCMLSKNLSQLPWWSRYSGWWVTTIKSVCACLSLS